MRPRKVAQTYAKGWFAMDLFTSFPFDVIADFSGPEANPSKPRLPSPSCPAGSELVYTPAGPCCPSAPCMRSAQRFSASTGTEHDRWLCLGGLPLAATWRGCAERGCGAAAQAEGGESGTRLMDAFRALKFLRMHMPWRLLKLTRVLRVR